MRSRALVASLGLAGLIALLVAQQPSDAAVTPPPASAPVVAAAVDAALVPSDAARAADTEAVAAADRPAVLTGLLGAATALGARDAQRAISIAESQLAEPGAAVGTETWFISGAILGRAHLQAGDPEAAIAALAPRFEHKKLAAFLPPDVLGVELAEAELAFARKPGVDAKAADARLEAGIARLRKLSKHEPIRNFAQMQVLSAQMLAELSDASGARKAVAALQDVLGQYPHHPERGRMWLEHARALDRAGRTKDAIAELRTITIERSGEPEGAAAWEELEGIAARTGKAPAPLGHGERLAAATAARRNKRMDVSRDLLEQLIADPSTPSSIRSQAERSRSFTASKQRDYGTCAADLRKAHAASGNLEVRDDLLKCLEKGAFYDEAIELRLADLRGKKAKKKAQRAHVNWEAMDLAVRGGKYERAKELLGRYEKDGKAHGQERAWLHPWLAMRLGDDAAAIAGFAAYEKKYRADAQATLDRLAADFGRAWPSITRARQLYAAGYNDEARRELRVTVQAYLTRGKKAGGPRSEDILVGLGWKANWKYPRVAPTKEGRKMLRDRDTVEALRVGLREVAFALQEPHAYVKLSTSKDAPFKARWTLRAFRPAVEREARLRKIDPKHMWALMYTESRFRPHVVSHVGARGALQIMPSTAHQLAERLGETDEGHFFDTDRLFDIDTNAHLSAYYVAELLGKFHGQAPMAYASYNGGPSNVARWLAAKSQSPAPLEMDTFIEEIVFGESYRYTKRVMEVHATYALLYEGDLPRWKNDVDPAYEDNIDF